MPMTLSKYLGLYPSTITQKPWYILYEPLGILTMNEIIYTHMITPIKSNVYIILMILFFRMHTDQGVC